MKELHKTRPFPLVALLCKNYVKKGELCNMKIGMVQAANLASVGGLKVGQPVMTDVCNGMARKANSTSVVPTLTLAVKFKWLSHLHPARHLSPSSFGYDGDLKRRLAGAPTEVAAKRAKWKGACPALGEMQGVRI